MLAATRLRLNERRQASERRATGRAGFKKMSTAVKVLSRLQLPADLLAEGGFVKKFDVGQLFDHRFEGIAAKSVPAEYRR